VPAQGLNQVIGDCMDQRPERHPDLHVGGRGSPVTSSASTTRCDGSSSGSDKATVIAFPASEIGARLRGGSPGCGRNTSRAGGGA
jgi:hypothetical protein